MSDKGSFVPSVGGALTPVVVPGADLTLHRAESLQPTSLFLTSTPNKVAPATPGDSKEVVPGLFSGEGSRDTAPRVIGVSRNLEPIPESPNATLGPTGAADDFEAFGNFEDFGTSLGVFLELLCQSPNRQSIFSGRSFPIV